MTSRRDILRVAPLYATFTTSHAEAGQDVARPAAGFLSFLTRREASAATIDSDVALVTTFGGEGPSDGGGATFVRRQGRAGALPVAFVSKDGGEWTWDPTQRIRVTMFGADAAGLRPAASSIQAALDYCMQAGIQQCWVPEGRYLIDDTIHLGYGDRPRSLSLIGECERGAYAGQLQGVRFLHLKGDRPIMNVQGARNSTIAGIGFSGYGPDGETSYVYKHIADVVFNPSTFNVSADPVDWLDAANIPTGLDRYRPYAAITIDAYAGSRPSDSYPDVRYPAWLPAMAQWNKAVSSAVAVRECSFRGFVAVVVTAPSGSDGNGDFTSIRDCDWGFCIYGITINHPQSRNVEIHNCRYAYCHTAISNRAFGLRNGKIGGPIDNLSGGQGYQIFDLNNGGSNGTITFRHCYAEASVRIGRWGSGYGRFLSTIRFEACEFNFNHRGPALGGVGTSPSWLLECNAPITPEFIGCVIESERFAMLVGPDSRGAIIENMMAVTGRDYIEKTHGAEMNDGVATAYNSFGGIFVNHIRGPQLIELRGTIEGSYFDRASPWTWQSQRLSSQARDDSDQRHDRLVHTFSKSILDVDGQSWPIVRHSPPFRIPASAWTAVRSDGMRLQGTCIFPRPWISDGLLRLEVGDLIYESVTQNLYAIVAAETVVSTGKCEIVAELQNNFKYSGKHFDTPVPISKFAHQGDCWLYKAAGRMSRTVWWGTFAVGSNRISEIDRGDGVADTCGEAGELEPGMSVTIRIFAPPGGGTPRWRWQISRLLSVENGSTGRRGLAIMDRPAMSSGRFVLAPVALSVADLGPH